MSNQYDLDPHFLKCIGYLYASKNLRKGDPVPLQYMLEEAIFQRTGIVKDYTDIFQSTLPPKESDDYKSSMQIEPIAIIEETKASNSDNELELDLFNDDLMCSICNQMDVGANNRLLECTDCQLLYHQECHIPPVNSDIIFKDWLCQNCKERKKLKKRENAAALSNRNNFNSSVSSTVATSSSSKSSTSHAHKTQKSDKRVAENKSSKHSKVLISENVATLDKQSSKKRTGEKRKNSH